MKNNIYLIKFLLLFLIFVIKISDFKSSRQQSFRSIDSLKGIVMSFHQKNLNFFHRDCNLPGIKLYINGATL